MTSSAHLPEPTADALSRSDLSADPRAAAPALPPALDAESLAAVRELVAAAKTVILGFDGPLCRLYDPLTARAATEALTRLLREHGVPAEEVPGRTPLALLRSLTLGALDDDPELSTALDALLTESEVAATLTARPTPYADNLVRTWSAVGTRLAVATGHAADAVHAYLAGRGLTACFGPHVHGRTGGLAHLGHDAPPRALAALGADPADALVVGSTPDDLRAARDAGAPFLGYARDLRGWERLHAAGATLVTGTLEPVRQAVWELNLPRR
ncbi:HAD family hydrolase [Streptomyces sp. NPDC058372]|uniref:HAD family hydrolase n=1 Tax=unclassified Streptomyces TaxID=2593676 RepID=UPI003663AC7C